MTRPRHIVELLADINDVDVNTIQSTFTDLFRRAENALGDTTQEMAAILETSVPDVRDYRRGVVHTYCTPTLARLYRVLENRYPQDEPTEPLLSEEPVQKLRRFVVKIDSDTTVHVHAHEAEVRDGVLMFFVVDPRDVYRQRPRMVTAFSSWDRISEGGPQREQEFLRQETPESDWWTPASK